MIKNLIIAVLWAFAGLLNAQDYAIDHAFLTWNPNQEPDLAGYRVYYGPDSTKFQFSKDVGFELGCEVDLRPLFVAPYTRFYFAVTAYDTAGNESGYSEKVHEVFFEHLSDVNSDGVVDVEDLVDINQHLGARVGNLKWFPRMDLNNDGVIDIEDKATIIKDLGRR